MNIHEDRRRVCQVSKSAFVRCNFSNDGHIIVFEAFWRADADACVFKEELIIDVGADEFVGVEDVGELVLDEVVIRVDVLLDESLYFEESR